MIYKISKLYKRFRAWQRHPMDYKPLTNESHVCLNCGQTFVGKYCPRCKQAAKTRNHVGWNTLLDGVKDTFDLETGTLARTFWHLLWRPGYLINDYLSGKRKVCTPPLNTFIMLSVVLMLLDKLLGIEPESVEPYQLLPTEGNLFFDSMRNWGHDNIGWYNIIGCLFSMFSIWILFRHSPRRPRHSLVEGFYIQVFIFMLVMIIDIFLTVIIGRTYGKWSVVLWPIYFLFALGPIFGYNWWGTLWRSVAAIYTGGRLFLMSTYIVDICMGQQLPAHFWRRQMEIIAILATILLVGYFIGWYTERRRKAKEGQ